MSRRYFAACIAALTATTMLTTGPAHASGVSAPESLIATFEGHRINLAQGWGAAHACLVWRHHGILECFRTSAELATRERQVRTSGPSRATTSSCWASLDLYSAPNYSGLQLSLRDEGYWQELSYAGFDNTTVSFLGGACAFHLAQGNWGQGYWYPGNTGAWSAAPDMGSWDRTVSSVYIN